MYCENCGNLLLDGAKFCGSCGSKTEPAQPVHAAAEGADPVRPAPPPPAYVPPAQAAPSYQQPYASQPPAYFEQPKSEPLRMGQYLGMLLLMFVPILGIVLLFVWSFGASANQNKKNLARAMLIVGAIGMVLSIVVGIVFSSILEGLIGNIVGYY
ncbi:MAG: zinc ribbon domain-containing protein [Oscillospiraceae bacterium]|jgi:hypothetical protein